MAFCVSEDVINTALIYFIQMLRIHRSICICTKVKKNVHLHKPCFAIQYANGHCKTQNRPGNEPRARHRLEGMETPFKDRVISQFTVFDAAYQTDIGVDLTQPPFAKHAPVLRHSPVICPARGSVPNFASAAWWLLPISRHALRATEQTSPCFPPQPSAPENTAIRGMVFAKLATGR